MLEGSDYLILSRMVTVGGLEGRTGTIAAARHMRSLQKGKGKRDAKAIPMAQVRSMFQQRLQALMLQDIKAARRMWREFADGEDAHVLTVEQFHQVMQRIGVHCSFVECQELIDKFCDRSNVIRFDEFWTNIMGFPKDFFSMAFVKGSSGAKMGLGGGSTAQIKPLLPATTSVETLDRKFKSEIRQRLFQVPLALTRILRCSNSQTHMDRNQLCNVFQNLGIVLSNREVDELMAHFDHNADGLIHFKEMAHELLLLPRPREVRHIAHARRSKQGLSERCRALVTCLRMNIERAAAPPNHVLDFFKTIDRDGSGQIAYDEFVELVRDNGCQLAGERDAAAILLNKYSKTGRLSYMRFITEVLELRPDALRNLTNPQRVSTPEKVHAICEYVKHELCSKPSAIKKAFHMFDVDGGGSIGLPEFEKGIDALGLPMSCQQSKQLFASFDDSGDGKLDAMEFAQKALGLGEHKEPSNEAKATSSKKQETHLNEPHRGGPSSKNMSEYLSRPRPTGGGMTPSSTIFEPLHQPFPSPSPLLSNRLSLGLPTVPSRAATGRVPPSIGRCKTALSAPHTIPSLRAPLMTPAHREFLCRSAMSQHNMPGHAEHPLEKLDHMLGTRGKLQSIRRDNSVSGLKSEDSLRSNFPRSQGDALRCRSPPPKTMLKAKADAKINSRRSTFT